MLDEIFPCLYSVYVVVIHYYSQLISTCCVNRQGISGENYETLPYKCPKYRLDLFGQLQCSLDDQFAGAEKLWGRTDLGQPASSSDIMAAKPTDCT
ncbi:hypothetical protein VCR20J5_1240170 [Vibrio crassostreae]|nr:hypothetical protein VCR20J5_1240170 [Vibrio crassostreae]